MTDIRSLASRAPGRARPDLRRTGASIAPARYPFGRMLAAMLALTVIGVVALVLPLPALAQEPTRLQDQVTDLTGRQVLASGRSRIDASLAELRRARNVQLFVLFVETTGNRTVT